jgi:hypothetical protein
MLPEPLAKLRKATEDAARKHGINEAAPPLTCGELLGILYMLETMARERGERAASGQPNLLLRIGSRHWTPSFSFPGFIFPVHLGNVGQSTRLFFCLQA